MENININTIPKGQKVVIRQRPNGNTEIFLRPDLENGQMVFGEWSGWLIAVVFGLLLLLGMALFSSKNVLAKTEAKEQPIEPDNYDTYTYSNGS